MYICIAFEMELLTFAYVHVLFTSILVAAEESCHDCDLEKDWICKSEKRIWIKSKEVPNPYSDRALKTVPDELIVKNSSIENAGLGVWTTQNVPECVVFGPYEGEIVSEPSDYAWWVYDANDEPTHLIDAADPKKSNWLRYVNCPMNEDLENLVYIQHRGNVYYQTKTAIPAGTELFVWYGDEYAKDLGLLDDELNDEL